MRILLKEKKISNEKASLYIEYYKGYTKNEEGKIKHNRQMETLKLYVWLNPTTAGQKLENKEARRLAEDIYSIRKSEELTGKFGIVNPHKGKVRVIDYFNSLKEKRSGYLSNYGVWVTTKRYIDQYFHKSLTFSELTPELIEGFKKFLDVEATTKYGTALKHGSKYSYFNRFRTLVKAAYEEGYVTDVRLLKIKSFDEKEAKREYLTLPEVQLLAATECKYPVLKRAFLFSCMTGLRWSDVYKLKWQEVRDENGFSRIVFTQQKTDNTEYLYISKQARELLGERSTISDRVFVGLQYGSAITTELLRWSMKAGITKHVTFHTSRHTAATLLLAHGADLYTVMKSLGHRDIRTTQIYAKILDEKLKEAANLLPTLNIEL